MVNTVDRIECMVFKSSALVKNLFRLYNQPHSLAILGETQIWGNTNLRETQIWEKCGKN